MGIFSESIGPLPCEVIRPLISNNHVIEDNQQVESAMSQWLKMKIALQLFGGCSNQSLGGFDHHNT